VSCCPRAVATGPRELRERELGFQAKIEEEDEISVLFSRSSF
jgi:hypothetical protein